MWPLAQLQQQLKKGQQEKEKRREADRGRASTAAIVDPTYAVVDFAKKWEGRGSPRLVKDTTPSGSSESLRRVTFKNTVEVKVIPDGNATGHGGRDGPYDNDEDCDENSEEDEEDEDEDFDYDVSTPAPRKEGSVRGRDTSSAARVYHEGWMTKRGGGWINAEDKSKFSRRSRKRRWFVLSENILKYYAKPGTTGKKMQI